MRTTASGGKDLSRLATTTLMSGEKVFTREAFATLETRVSVKKPDKNGGIHTTSVFPGAFICN